MQYQVALSFAGEQREYVKDVARQLRSRGIEVFYDEFHDTDLWGKNLAEYFQEIFQHKARYVVMFISSTYVEKYWPRHEGRAAMSRAIREQTEYILPVRFDNTDVPGLSGNIGYMNAKDHEPATLAVKIIKKLGIKPSAIKASDIPPPYLDSLIGEVVFDYSSHNGRYVIGKKEFEFETKWSKAGDTSIHIYNDPDSINGIALANECKSIADVVNAESLDYTSRARTPKIGEIVVLRNIHDFYAALQVLEISADELRFRYAIQSNGSDSFADCSSP